MPQISLIKYSDIKQARRYDSEYFKPEYLKIAKVSSNIKRFKNFRDFNLGVDASAFYPSIEPLYNTGKLPFLRVANVDREIDYNSAVTIPEEILEDFKTIKVAKKGDIVITKGGSIARLGYIDKDSALSRDLIYINSSQLNELDSKYLYFYLLSDFTNKLLLRSSSLTSQPHLTILQVRELPIFSPNDIFKKEIANYFDLSKEKQTQSKELYKQAEELLLAELGLLNHEINHKKTFSTTKKAINEAHRFDSEYFQPKYDEIIRKVEEYEGGSENVKDIINFKDKNFTPEDNKKYKYLALANISSQGYINDFQEEFGKDLPTRARRKINTGDVIISSIEGSLSSSAIVEEEFDNAICSTGFFVLNSKVINSETLLILFKSSIIQELLQRGAKGTILTAISKTELEQIKIPLIKPEIQKEIAQKIELSHKLRKESKELLEGAKRKVEEEIEKGV